MSFEELVHTTVENFLAEQRNNLLEDRQSLTALLKKILHDQQVLPVENIAESDSNLHRINNEPSTDGVEENRISFESKVAADAEYRELHSTENTHHLKEFNSQNEKERLAKLFENAPCTLTRSVRQNREFGRRRKNSKYEGHSENKENEPLNEVSETDFSERKAVRCGEFSPLNPAFRSDKIILGLGEYELLRKTFLEKKKREYVQYFQNDKVMKLAGSDHSKSESRSSKLKFTSSQQKEFSSRDVHTPLKIPTFSEVEKVMSDFKKYQQAAYRQELDKQIEEKKKQRQIEKECEEKTCEIWSNQEMAQRRNLMNDLKKKFCERIECKSSNKGEQATEIPLIKSENVEPCSTFSHNNESANCLRENKVFVSSRLPSPILNPSTEACAVDNYEKYQQMQKELYKKDLAEQIKEKRRIERERKLKEMEIERKIEENVRKEEEKLRLQYEKELAERNYRATQKAQIEKQLQENLCRIQKQNEERKKLKKVISSEACNIYPTKHHVNEKPKNVTFASHAFMHCIPAEHALEEEFGRSTSKEVCTTGAMIVHAPYVLAVKDGFSDNPHRSRPRSPSPVIPAIRTRNLINALPKSDAVELPAGVSMSEGARNRFMKDERILSNLSEIRRKLLENQSKCNVGYNENLNSRS